MSRMLPGDLSMSMGSESIPISIQAEIEHAALDEATASGLFDMADEPGMERIPVTIHLPVTPELAAAIARTQAGPMMQQPAEDIAPPPRTRRRFARGGTPKLFASLKALWSEQDRTPHRPEQTELAQAGEEPPAEERLGPEGKELTLREEANQNRFNNDARELRQIDPQNLANSRLQSPGWIPADADVARMDEILQKARAAKSGAPAQDARDGATLKDLLLPKQPALPPSYVLGESDGGPGIWVKSPKYPRRQADAAYQQIATGAPEGVEYQVKAVLRGDTKETAKLFDGYDPSTGHLLDAKRWDHFPPDFLMSQKIEKVRNDAKIAEAAGHLLELRISSSFNAGRVDKALKERDVTNTIVESWPKQ